jgi:hypothetical protein
MLAWFALCLASVFALSILGLEDVSVEEHARIFVRKEEFTEPVVRERRNDTVYRPSCSETPWDDATFVIQVSDGFCDFAVNWLTNLLMVIPDGHCVMTKVLVVAHSELMGSQVARWKQSTALQGRIELSLWGGGEVHVGSQPMKWASAEYNELMGSRPKLLIGVQQSIGDMIFSDVDLAFQSDPRPWLSRSKSLSTIMDTGGPCAGFFAVRNDTVGRGLLASWRAKMRGRSQRNQPAYVDTLRRMGKNDYHALPVSHFANGEAYFLANPAHTLSQFTKRHTVVVHANYIIGSDAKREALRNVSLWNPDPSLLEGCPAEQAV